MEINYKDVKVIAFDADDTLWVNEPYFRNVEHEVAKLLAPYETLNKIHQEIYRVEIANLHYYGYGIKPFILSMIELALDISNHQVAPSVITKILDLGKDMLFTPIELLPGVEEILAVLSKKYKLIVATKGDLLDQERKLEKSGLLSYFHHVEVMSDKKEPDYKKIMTRLEVEPSEFLMIGNSLRSDVLPLINMGSKAIHIPFHTTWLHEQVESSEQSDTAYKTLQSVSELSSLF